MKKILIVEDDRTFSNILKEVLMAKKYDVSASYDGEDALQKLEAGEKPDLILLDIRMPKVDGLEFLKRLRAKSNNVLPIPTVIMSNLEDLNVISQAISLGAKGYVLKSEEGIEKITQDVEKALSVT